MNSLTRKWARSYRSNENSWGPEWLGQMRERAVRQLESHGLPMRRDEAWKYTSMDALERLEPDIVTDDLSADAVSDATPGDALSEADHRIDIVDGRVDASGVDAEAGLSVFTLEQGFERFEPRLRSFMEKMDLSGSAGTFASLSTAFLEQGAVITVGPEVDAGELLVRWSFSGGRSSRMHNVRLFVLLEPGARLRLVEHFHGGGSERQAVNVVTDVELAENASLRHVRVQNEADSTVLITSQRTVLKSSSEYRYSGFDLGGRLVRHQMTAELAGAGASASFAGAFVVDGERLVDNHINVEHAAPDCASEQFFRGVLGGRGKGVFNGRALIRPGADGSRVRQSNANLLLSDLAEMDTKPELEIYADEVEASHGATVGQLDEIAIFYLRSRGLTEAAARLMLTGAFCRAVSDRLKPGALAQRIADLIDEAMPESRNENARDSA